MCFTRNAPTSVASKESTRLPTLLSHLVPFVENACAGASWDDDAYDPNIRQDDEVVVVGDDESYDFSDQCLA